MSIRIRTWRTARGFTIPIRDMTDEHLVNCIKHTRSKAVERKNEVTMMNVGQVAIKKPICSLTLAIANARQNVKDLDQYESLIAEATRRGLEWDHDVAPTETTAFQGPPPVRRRPRRDSSEDRPQRQVDV